MSQSVAVEARTEEAQGKARFGFFAEASDERWLQYSFPRCPPHILIWKREMALDGSGRGWYIVPYKNVRQLIGPVIEGMQCTIEFTLRFGEIFPANAARSSWNEDQLANARMF